MVSWVGSPRIIHIPFSWLGGSSAQNHDFFFFAVHFFQRIVIDHFRIMDSGLASWELQEYLVCALSCGFRIFPLKNKYRRLEGSSCCRLLWLSQSLLSVPWSVGDQMLWRMGRWESIFDGCFFFCLWSLVLNEGERKRISSWERIMKAILQRLLFAHFCPARSG
ncbi:hypothetical protein GGI43DRAFT_136070 [Trichoderma evansii]